MQLTLRLLLLASSFLASCSLASPLQDAIDEASPYSSIKLSNARYIGNIIINKPLSIIGIGDSVIIDGDAKGTVITINSSDVTLQNLSIINSGDRMENLDSGIRLNSVQNINIKSCAIQDTLYGIDMNIVKNSKITSNYINSKDIDISLKGNALKLYYTNNTVFENNVIDNSRDVTLNYSNDNNFTNNTFTNNRFATHLSLSHRNIFDANIYEHNSVSMMFMGTKDTLVINNTIKSSDGAAGIGIIIGHVSNFRFEYNTLKYNAKAIYIDSKEKALGMKRYINYNEISYNGEAIHFHAAIKDNTITHNKIFGNIEDVVKDIEGYFSDTNLVEYNYWDRYAGFDRDDDNIGDTSHKIYQYADQLWHYNHKVKFFYASPIMSLLNFLANLAPFVEPNLLLIDAKPLMRK